MTQAVVYLQLDIGPGNPGIDSQPMNADANGFILSSDNVTVTSTNVSTNFSYGDPLKKVKEWLSAAVRAQNSGVDLDVIFS